MTDKRKNIKATICALLGGAVASDYIVQIADSILDDVVDDIEECADADYNLDDIRLAIGRVLEKRLEII